ncbi:hypothetical protein K402DRAFT_423209 [Aulographum hederae CBS 113979]|uniref:Uncharacterized protein n=1 Tax=Aulographum hederae CBS 113979 TaxID=1176131 RepID=A0A6G1GT52_9PEZI|nr:hypothetical protein K402DRAFT_423209 [Aulographum hederae CBS 113979]
MLLLNHQYAAEYKDRATKALRTSVYRVWSPYNWAMSAVSAKKYHLAHSYTSEFAHAAEYHARFDMPETSFILGNLAGNLLLFESYISTLLSDLGPIIHAAKSPWMMGAAGTGQLQRRCILSISWRSGRELVSLERHVDPSWLFAFSKIVVRVKTDGQELFVAKVEARGSGTTAIDEYGFVFQPNYEHPAWPKDWREPGPQERIEAAQP